MFYSLSDKTFMVYQIKDGVLCIRIDRAEILDICPGDLIEIPGLQTQAYEWKHQDSQFLESNPDAEIYLLLEASENGGFEPVSITIKTLQD